MFSLIILLSVSNNLSENLTEDWIAKSSPINWATHQLFGKEKQFDSLNVRFVGNWPFGLSYAGTYDSINQRVFMGSGTGVYVLDVSTPTNPIKLSERLHDRWSVHWRMLYSDSLLYIAYHASGEFKIWNVNNIFSPIKIGEINISCSYNDMEIFGNYAFTVGNECSLHIIDISTPSNPQQISSYLLPGAGYGVTVAGNYAYVADYNRGLRIIDISNPYNPQEIGSYDTAYAHDVAVSGNYAYVSGGNQFGKLRVIDVSNPSNPQKIAELGGFGWGIGKIKISGKYLYAFFGTLLYEFFGIVDISNPYNPQLVGFCLPSGVPYDDMKISGNYAYIVTNVGGLEIVNISTPSNPFVIGHYDNPGFSVNIVTVGNYAYITLSSTPIGLRIIDISTPSDPIETGFCYTPGGAGDLAISGGYAYVAGAFISIIDVSNPSNPIIVGQYSPGGDVAVSGNYLYVTYGSDTIKLDIVDVSTPSSPQLVGYCSIPVKWEYPVGIGISGNYAYITTLDSGLYVIDISTPSNPVQVGHLSVPWGVVPYLEVSDSFAYIVGWDSSSTVLRVINVANPSNPWVVGSLSIPGGMQGGVGIFHNYVYLDIGGALRVIDVSIPSNPQQVGFYKPVWQSIYYTHTGASGKYIYKSCDPYGMEIYENLLVGIEEENSKIKVENAKLQIYPNPVIHCATIEYQLPLESEVLLRIYDVSGKLVKEVLPGNVCSGKHKIKLSVDTLPSGVYFLQYRMGDKKLNHKLIVIGTGK